MRAVGVLVVGSVNADVVLRVPRLPAPGETVLGSPVEPGLGGKGANQAVASARTDVATALVGAVGDDGAGAMLLERLRSYGVDVAGVRRGQGRPSGTAYVLVDARGENSIVVVPGANASVVADDALPALGDATVVVVQGEVPLPTVEATLPAARAAGCLVVLNLAPFAPVAAEALAAVDVLVVNEGEAAGLLGREVGSAVPDAAAAAGILASRTACAAVITLGSRGAVWATVSDSGHVAAPSVPVVDTTGAGDAFVGVLAASLSRGRALPAAVQHAITAASRSVGAAGAAASYPTFDC